MRHRVRSTQNFEGKPRERTTTSEARRETSTLFKQDMMSGDLTIVIRYVSEEIIFLMIITLSLRQNDEVV